jgi:hypothetical protein
MGEVNVIVITGKDRQGYAELLKAAREAQPKRYVVYYDEGVEGGPKAEVKEGTDITALFSEDDGWTYANQIEIINLNVNQTTREFDGLTYTVMVWRVQ